MRVAIVRLLIGAWLVVAGVVGAPAGAQQVLMNFDQPAQPLASALRAFARTTGRSVVFDDVAMADRRAPALRGRFTPEAAIERLLGDSGFSAQRGRTGVFVVTARASAVRAAPSSDLDDVILVTARKRSEVARNIPIAVSAVSGRQAERYGYNSVGDILARTAGVGVYDYGEGLAKITIRGVSTSLGANENGYYLNDLPFTGVTVPISPDVRAWDLERVEVLRGPQGTLFGEGSMGGTVRILTRPANLDDWEARGLASLSDTGDGGLNRGFKGIFNAPMIPGVLGIRLSATYEHFPGWIDNEGTGGRNLNDQTFRTFRASARLKPTSRLTIDGNYWRFRSTFPGGGSRASDQGDQPLSGVLASRLAYDLYGLTARYDLGGAELFYGFSSNDFSAPQWGTFLGGALIADIAIHVEAHEARIASNGGGALQWTVGGYLRDARRTDNFEFPLFGFDHNLDRTDSRARALFGEATYMLGRFDLTAGLRYYVETLSGFEANSGVVTPDEGDTYRSWNPRFSIAWRPVPDATIYASAAKGFRAGQLQPTTSRALAKPLGIALPAALAQDSIWSYELGAKADLLDRKLTVEGALFYSRWKDVAVRIPLGDTGFNGLISSKGTETMGVELSLVARPLPGLTLMAGGAYIDATYKGDVAGTGIVDGAPVDDVATFTANASVDYGFTLGGTARGFARIGWQHSSPRNFRAFAGYLPGDMIDRVDARITFDFGRFTLALFADNLTDDRGAINARTVQPLGAGILDITANRLRPRTLGIEAGFAFGDSARH